MKKIYSNFVAGANTSLSPFLAADNNTFSQDGFVTSYKLGSALKRLGYLRVGDVAQANKAITGLFDFQQSPSVQKTLITMNDSTDDDTQLFYNNAGTWTEIAGAETAWANKANINVEMESFIGYCFIVGYGATDGYLPVGSLTGTTFSTVTNVTNMPGAKYIVRYRDRLYIGNTDIAGSATPYRVYYSSIPSAGAITWTTATDNFDVDLSDQITGMSTNWDLLIIFTKRRAYYYNQTAKKELWKRGCDNHRTIKNSGGLMFFANRDGVWVSQNGGEPENIAGPVIDFIRNGDATTFFAEIVDEEYHLYVGDVTVNGVAYTNTDLIFNIPTTSWRWEEYAADMSVFGLIDSSGDDRLYMGASAGQVWDKSKYTDASPVYSDGKIGSTEGSDILATMETRIDPLDDPDVLKKLVSVTVYADRAQQVKMQVKTFDNNTRGVSKYLPLGTLKGYVTKFEGLDLNFNLLQSQFSEFSKLPYFSIHAVEIEYVPIGITLNDK